MSKISPPARSPGDPDRVLDCEFYLVPVVIDNVDLALAAGWSDEEIGAALISLTRRRLLARSSGSGQAG